MAGGFRLGLSTFSGSDGLHVFVRSLDSAGPKAEVELRLYSRNNTKLGQALTDDNGYASFDRACYVAAAVEKRRR
ncbi:MAG: hypothetical protein R3F37_18495 [Candidatus Competibacteraceae bacterium]